MPAEFKWTPEAIEAATNAVKAGRAYAVSIPGEKYLFVAPEDEAYDVLVAAAKTQPVVGRSEYERLRQERDKAIDLIANLRASLDAAKAQPVVALPPCPTCGGTKVDPTGPQPRDSLGFGTGAIGLSCPACNGSGVDRLIPESEIRAWIEGQPSAPGELVDWLDEWKASR